MTETRRRYELLFSLLLHSGLRISEGIVKLNAISEVGRLRSHERHQESLYWLPLPR